MNDCSKSMSTNFIIEPQRTIPVKGKFDVVVVGGGIAGIAAAIAAARNGAKTCIIEKECTMGGLATLANVIIYLPICNGNGNQVIAGLGEELLRLSVADNPNAIPRCWRTDSSSRERKNDRFRVVFNPWMYALALEKLLADNNVSIYYDTRFCGVLKENNRISVCLIENKGGRQAIVAKTVVDASGDADVCALAEEETISLATNVRAGWFFYHDQQKIKIKKYSAPFKRDGSVPENDRFIYAGDNGDDISRHMLDSRAEIRTILANLQAQNTSAYIEPVNLAKIPSFRMTRRLKGTYELRMEDMHKWFDDAIGLMPSWREPGPVFSIPYRCLTAVKTANLITAGRCISAKGSAWDLSRAIPVCSVTGEASGTAAAMVAQDRSNSFNTLQVAVLQDQLRKQNVILDKNLVLRGPLRNKCVR